MVVELSGHLAGDVCVRYVVMVVYFKRKNGYECI